MRRSLIVVFFTLFGLAGQASAEGGDQYWMFKAGLSWFNNSDKPDNMKALNLTYGYGITTRITAELDYQQSADGGAYKNDNGEEGKYAYKMGSIGAAYRYVFYESLYFRGKLALAYGNEERTSNLVDTDTSDVTNVTGSLALGLLAGDVIGSSLTLELEYLQQSSDLNSVLLGANITF